MTDPIADMLARIRNATTARHPRVDMPLSRLKVEQGDCVFLTELPDGYRVIAFDETLIEQVNEGRDFMREFRETFRALAK